MIRSIIIQSYPGDRVVLSLWSAARKPGHQSYSYPGLSAQQCVRDRPIMQHVFYTDFSFGQSNASKQWVRVKKAAQAVQGFAGYFLTSVTKQT